MELSELPKNRLIQCMLLVALLVGTVACGEQSRTAPKAVDGVLDLSDWDFEKDGAARLRGEWRFVWGELVEPMPIEAFREQYKASFSVPQHWNLEPHPHIPGEALIGHGHATYVLEIRLPKSIQVKELNFFLMQGGRQPVRGISFPAIHLLSMLPGIMVFPEHYQKPQRRPGLTRDPVSALHWLSPSAKKWGAVLELIVK